MVQLFTQRRRLDVLDKLTAFFAADRSIAGLVLVGSSAEDDIDMYSGIDLLVVVSNSAVFPSVYRKWKNRIDDIFAVEYEYEAESGIDRGSYSIMLEDYLEINLFFTSFKSLVAEHRPWIVIFDHTGSNDILPTLQATYRTESVAGPARSYRLMISSVWQPIIKCVAALNRKEMWRAMHMVEIVRQKTIELAALNHHIDMRNYAEVDQLPEMLLIQLRHTLPTSTDAIGIRRALLAVTNLFFSQAIIFEEGLQFNMAEDVHVKLKSYIEAYA